MISVLLQKPELIGIHQYEHDKLGMIPIMFKTWMQQVSWYTK